MKPTKTNLAILLIFLCISPHLALNIGNIIPNNPLSLPVEIDGTVINAKITLDSNWHWIHAASDPQKSCRQVCNTP
jgi:hypothetical protein